MVAGVLTRGQHQTVAVIGRQGEGDGRCAAAASVAH